MNERNATAPPVGETGFGKEGVTARLEPVSRTFGFDRGLPICRHYIEKFLSANRPAIKGTVLEFGSDAYTKAFGSGVTTSRILVTEPSSNPQHVVADLTKEGALGPERYDCIICTQVLCCTYDFRVAVKNMHDSLKPGGVILATLPGLAQVSRFDYDRWGDYWRFNDLSSRTVFQESFSPENLQVVPRGNVQVAMAYLLGLASEELSAQALDHVDEDYQTLVEVRAVKGGAGPS